MSRRKQLLIWLIVGIVVALLNTYSVIVGVDQGHVPLLSLLFAAIGWTFTGYYGYQYFRR